MQRVHRWSVLFISLVATACRVPEPAQGDRSQPPRVDAVPAEPEADAAVELVWDEDGGTLRMAVDPEVGDLLYMVSLPGGLGSNDVGLDRGQIGTRLLVRFERSAGRLFLVAPNLDWRSSSDSPTERSGVRDSFAASVLWGFDILEEGGDGTLWVDAGGFFLRDAHDIARKLAGAGQGTFRLAADRSTLLPASLRCFPDNSLIEARLTFTASDPGREVRSTAPVAQSVSLRVRHTFVRLPALEESDYRPRSFEPRSGFFALGWNDMTGAVDESTRRQVLQRHHLTEGQPIRYYVDTAAPEPVRTALLEGARYWVPVFEQAGYPGGFQVELLPDGADPLDLRYNVIQWVHRSTRGWSYGDAVSDPRTGQILKGHVTLGALRVRQDVLLLEGLLAPYDRGAGDERVVEVALDRIRQLAAHEVGHTLGLAHNFAASVDGRASVMDYPAPQVKLRPNGKLNLAQAYRDGCGEWDAWAIRYGYADLGDEPEQEAAALRALLKELDASGLHYLSDADARGADRAHPLANLWDNGADPVEALQGTYDVRAHALERLGPAALKPGRPLAELERVLVPLYLHHRYQLEACLRAVGGVEYEHRMVGDLGPNRGLRAVPLERQRDALRIALESLRPEFLELPTALAARLVPPPPGSGRSRESFEPRDFEFDLLAPARSGATLTLDLLFAHGRLERLAGPPLDPENPGMDLDELFGRLFEGTLFAPGPRDALRLELQSLGLDRLIQTARSTSHSPAVRATAWRWIGDLMNAGPKVMEPWLRDRLRRFLDRPSEFEASPRPPRVPPGSPIGCGWG